MLYEIARIQFALLAVCFAVSAFAVGTAEFKRVRIDEIRLGGEFERRLMMTVTNNLLKAEIENQFLSHFRTKENPRDSVGTGKLIESSVRLGVYTGNKRVIALKDYLVEELLKTQSDDGYIGALRKDSRIWGYWDLAETGFIFLGLAADHRYFGSKRSLAAACRAADYMIDNWHTMPEGWEDAYISGTAAAVGFAWGLYALYEETGDVKYRDFAVRARGIDRWYRPVTIGRGYGIHGHSATHLHQCLMQCLYRAAGVDTPRRATDETVRFMLDGNGSLITGSCGLWECWCDDQSGRLSPGETCSTGYQLWLWDALMRGERIESRWGDAMERTVFNALFGAQSETGRQIRYYMPIEGRRSYYPSDTYCCPNNFRRIMSELPEFVFYKSASALYANLYTSCELKTELACGRVEIRETTDYPTGDRILFSVTPEADLAAFDMILRIPGWCEAPSLSVNGLPVAARTGALAHVKRDWRKGDRVELRLPMRVKTIAGRRRQAGRVAFMRGPIVYALNPVRNGGKMDVVTNAKTSALTAEDQKEAERAAFFSQDPADVCATMLVDPATVRVVSDETVRPNGTALAIRAATSGHATGVNEKNSSEIVLSEFPDVGATATYFRVSDLKLAEADDLFR